MISPAGETQMESCAEKAERVTEFTTAAAQDCILEQLRSGAKTGEVLVWGCREAGLIPHDDRAFGAAFAGLSRRGLIHKIGVS